MPNPVRGFEAYEEIALVIPNFNFGGKTPEEAQALVQAGTHRWAICHGMALTLVPTDYQLKMAEYFVTRTAKGWEKIP